MTRVTDLDKQLQKLAKEFAASSAKSEDLVKKVAETSKDVQIIGRDLQTNQEMTEKLARTVEANSSKIQTLVDQISLYKSQMEKSNPKNNGFSSLSENLASTVQKLDSFKVELSRVNESIFLLRSEEKEITEKLEMQDAGISDARSRIESLVKDTVPRLTNQVESFEEKFQAWGEKISNLTKSNTESSPKPSPPSNDHDSTDEMTRQLVMINQRLEGLEKNMIENNSRIEGIQSNLAKNSKRPAMIESEISTIGPEMFDEF